jgi:hypothetical protein
VTVRPAKTLRECLRESHAILSTTYLEALALACVDVLRDRGRALGIELEQDQHATALRVIERLAASARAVEGIAQADAANANNEPA